MARRGGRDGRPARGAGKGDGKPRGWTGTRNRSGWRGMAGVTGDQPVNREGGREAARVDWDQAKRAGRRAARMVWVDEKKEQRLWWRPEQGRKQSKGWRGWSAFFPVPSPRDDSSIHPRWSVLVREPRPPAPVLSSFWRDSRHHPRRALPGSSWRSPCSPRSWGLSVAVPVRGTGRPASLGSGWRGDPFPFSPCACGAGPENQKSISAASASVSSCSFARAGRASTISRIVVVPFSSWASFRPMMA